MELPTWLQHQNPQPFLEKSREQNENVKM
jgi:hypothetical protein